MALHTVERDPLEMKEPINSGYLRLDVQTTKLVIDLSKKGKMPWQRFLVEARHRSKKPDDDYRLEGRYNSEIVLDLNVAETASPGRFEKVASKLPWANGERPWTPEDFLKLRNDDIYRRMADFVVARPVDVVLSPSHLAGAPGEPWLPVDIEGFHALRAALDRLDAVHIAIDYLLMAPLDRFLDPAWRSQVIAAIRSAPFDRLWVRVGGFGHRHEGEVAGMVRALVDFHQFGRPIIADFCGGLVGLSLIATGVVAAIGHGVGRAEKVDFENWMTPPPPPKEKKNVPSPRAYFGALDGYMDRKRFMEFFEPKSRRDEFGVLLPDRYFEERNLNFLRDRAAQFQALLGHSPADRLREFQGGLRNALWELGQIAQQDAENNLDVKQLTRAHKHMSALEAALTDVAPDIRTIAAAPPFRGHGPGNRPFRLTG
jgi:hypothetical protein